LYRATRTRPDRDVKTPSNRRQKEEPTGDIDIYSYTVADPNVFETVKVNDKLVYSMAVGNYDTIMFNFLGPVFEGTGKLNPFAVEEIRQAMNLLIDRDYILQEIVGGWASTRPCP
jgi:peptide/nickel transport system substrate-binding protein